MAACVRGYTSDLLRGDGIKRQVQTPCLEIRAYTYMHAGMQTYIRTYIHTWYVVRT